MIDLSPKNQFQKLRKDDFEAFAKILPEPFMRTALTYAFAEMGQGGITPEELNGAKRFIAIFVTITDPVENQKMPSRTLMSETEILARAELDQNKK